LARPIIVTGAGGFIGRHLVSALQRCGEHVVVPARRDIGPDTDWGEALRGAGTVIHLAALAHERAGVYERRRDYQALRRVNALGTERLALSAARAGVRQFIFLSSIGVLGDETGAAPFTEDSLPAPRSLYATSKLEAEQLLARLVSPAGLSVTSLRPTLVYGPGNGGNLLRLMRLIERGLPLPFASVRNKRTLTSVHNIVSAIVSVLDRAGTHETFVVCDAESISTGQIVRHLAEGMERPVRLFPLPKAALRAAGRLFRSEALVSRLYGSLEADCSKLTRLTGWQPLIFPSDGLRETGAWFREQSQRA
jgi:nucleoside-diphosphate-sugar epimerase